MGPAKIHCLTSDSKSSPWRLWLLHVPTVLLIYSIVSILYELQIKGKGKISLRGDRFTLFYITSVVVGRKLYYYTVTKFTLKHKRHRYSVTTDITTHNAYLNTGEGSHMGTASRLWVTLTKTLSWILLLIQIYSSIPIPGLNYPNHGNIPLLLSGLERERDVHVLRGSFFHTGRRSVLLSLMVFGLKDRGTNI